MSQSDWRMDVEVIAADIFTAAKHTWVLQPSSQLFEDPHTLKKNPFPQKTKDLYTRCMIYKVMEILNVCKLDFLNSHCI